MVIQGGANLVRYPPAFSNDGKRLLVCTASSVTVFSVATALPVLQLNGHADLVTSVSVIPSTKVGNSAGNHVWTSSLDGTIRLWDFVLGNVTRTLTYGKPIESMVIPSLLKSAAKTGNNKHENIAFISVRMDKENQDIGWTGRIVLFNLTTGKPVRGVLAKTSRPRRLVVSPHGSFVGIAEKKKLCIWSIPDGAIGNAKLIRSIALHHTKICGVLAFDPTETLVAGGDETGRILCWHNFGERNFPVNCVKDDIAGSMKNVMSGGVRGKDDAEACTTFHWHADEVKSLLFSSDGTYLFSGGSNGTLVIWQPETGKQQFLPRLGGQLLYITCSPDPSVFAISCATNAIRFVNIGSMSVERSCEGIKPVVALPKDLNIVSSTRVAFMSQGGKLILPTENLCLQFYDTVCDHELFEVQIGRSTNGAGTNDKRNGWSGPMTFVTHVTFSTNGSVMATVDVRLPEENIGGGSCLKFWDRQMTKPDYVLNTIVDEPHGAEITGIVYHPTEQMVVTCSRDATFRVWVKSDSEKVKDEYFKVSGWRCRSVGSYRHKEMLATAISPDGSLLAVAAEDLVTLWNPYTNGFVGCLTCVPSPQKIILLAFVHNCTCLVAASSGLESNLIVWQLSTLSVLWSCYVRVEALSVDPNSSHFGIIALAPSEKNKPSSGDASSRKAYVALFTPESPIPIAVWSLQEGVGGTLFFGSSDFLSHPTWRSRGSVVRDHTHKSCMVVLTGSREYVVLNPYSREDDAKTDDAKTVAPLAKALTETVPSAYFTMYGDVIKRINKERSQDVTGIRAPKPWGDLFNTPSHVLPSLSRLSQAFMESLLVKHSDFETKLLSGRDSEALPTL